MLRKLRTDKSGFTLIELMIVIAIIGILAAIAIPNFIAYRNKSYCSKAESDANNTAAAVADFYAIPSNTACVTAGDITLDTPNTIVPSCPSNNNPSEGIQIVVTDTSGRCPSDYKAAQDKTKDGTGYWVGSASDNYVKIMTQ